MATVPKHLHLGQEINANEFELKDIQLPLTADGTGGPRSRDLGRLRGSFSSEDLSKLDHRNNNISPGPMFLPPKQKQSTSLSRSSSEAPESTSGLSNTSTPTKEEILQLRASHHRPHAMDQLTTACEDEDPKGDTAAERDAATNEQGDRNAKKKDLSIAKLSNVILEKVKRQFSKDSRALAIASASPSSSTRASASSSYSKVSQRQLQSDWVLLEVEDQQLVDLKRAVSNLEKAFKFSKASTLVNMATSSLQRCELLVERSLGLNENCHMLFSHCSNEIGTLQDYLGKLRSCVLPAVEPKESKNGDQRNARRIEWAVSRMNQSLHSINMDIKQNLDEIDAMISECIKLMVQTITLLHMRGRSADFSGTGVAAGAAGVVAGAVVGAAGLIAAPATGGLSIPISIAGKGLMVTGVAALTPSSIMLNRHSQQLNGLARLIECLKSRLEIMNQKRNELALALAACEDAELNIKQTGHFCQDATELEISAYENAWSFIEAMNSRLLTLHMSCSLFLSPNSPFHFCCCEDELHQYLIPEADEN